MIACHGGMFNRLAVSLGAVARWQFVWITAPLLICILTCLLVAADNGPLGLIPRQAIILIRRHYLACVLLGLVFDSSLLVPLFGLPDFSLSLPGARSVPVRIDPHSAVLVCI